MAQRPQEQPEFAGRPYLRVYFECCNVYQRLYRDRMGRYYAGRCPRCLRHIRFRIGPGGTPAREFIVG